VIVLVLVQTFTRGPSEDEWIRSKRYASWVKVLDPSDTVMIPNNVFQQLSRATSGRPVCPNLQHLTWTSFYGWGGARISSHPDWSQSSSVNVNRKAADLAPPL